MTRYALRRPWRHVVLPPLQRLDQRIDRTVYNLILRASARVLRDPCQVFDHRPAAPWPNDDEHRTCMLCKQILVKSYHGDGSWDWMPLEPTQDREFTS